jgi:hypothetical protein
VVVLWVVFVCLHVIGIRAIFRGSIVGREGRKVVLSRTDLEHTSRIISNSEFLREMCKEVRASHPIMEGQNKIGLV